MGTGISKRPNKLGMAAASMGLPPPHPNTKSTAHVPKEGTMEVMPNRSRKSSHGELGIDTSEQGRITKEDYNEY